MNLIGKKVVLRAMEESDQEFLLAMINDPAIEQMVGGYSFPLSKKQQLEWFNKTSNDLHNIRLIITTLDGEAIGYANLVNIDWKNRTAFHGLKIHSKNNHSKGIGTDVVMTIMRYCFEELNLNRLETTILEHNQASQHLFIKKCGWSCEGIKRQSVYKNNHYQNELIVSILKSEYDALNTQNTYWDK